MTRAEPGRTLAHDPDALDEAKILLAKFPDVTADEQCRIGRFLRAGAPIDIGILSSDAELWKSAENFRRNHPEHFRVSARVYAAWVAAILLIGIALVVIKDIGLH